MCWHSSAVTHWRIPSGKKELHRTLDVQFREDNCRYTPTVKAVLRRTTLNMVRTAQQQYGNNTDQICQMGCCGTSLDASRRFWPRSWPKRDFTFALPLPQSEEAIQARYM